MTGGVAEGARPPAGPLGLLQVRPLTAGRRTVVVVAGEADLHTAPLLLERVQDALLDRPETLVLDISALTFCDLQGLDGIDEAVRQARARGVLVSVRGMSPQLAWLHRRFPRPRERSGPSA